MQDPLESELEEAKREIAELEQAVAPVREQLEEREWRRLSRLRQLRSASAILGGAGLILAVICLADYLLWSAYLPFAVAGAVVFAICVPVFFLASYLLGHKLELLAHEGENREGVEEALDSQELIADIRSRPRELGAEAQLRAELAAGPPWWVTELSGLHLLLWLVTVGVGTGAALLPSPHSGVWGERAAVLILPWMLKIAWLAFYWGYATPQTRRPMLRFYRALGIWTAGRRHG